VQTPADYQESKRKKKRLLIYALISIAVFVFIILPAGFLTGLWVSIRQERASRPPTVVVPNVVGQEYRKGELLLIERGLRMRVQAVRSDQNYPAGFILDQSPRAGESALANQEVTVVIGGESGHPITSPER
jgi:beta-lactam-binding protein with PASTA domain